VCPSGGHLHQPDEVLRRRGLDQESRRAGPQRAEHVLVGVERGQHHHGRRIGQLADPIDRGEPVHARHAQVHEHDVGAGADHRLDAGRPVLGARHDLDGAAGGQDRPQMGADHRLVVHHHDPDHAHATDSAVGT
jgi:hypothetical protein